MKSKVKKCQKCGCENQYDAIYCSVCGNKMNGRGISLKVAMVAAILVIGCVVFVVKEINEPPHTPASMTCYAYTESDEYVDPSGGASGYSITIKLKKLLTPQNVKGMLGKFQYSGTIEIEGHMCWFSGDVVGQSYSSGNISVYLSERHENSMYLINRHNLIMTLNGGHNKITWGKCMFDEGLVNASTETTIK